jgi:hypothetical protein
MAFSFYRRPVLERRNIMSFFSWLRNRTATRPPQGRARSTLRSFRPQLEILEGRDVPSTLTVTNNLDSGAGSLRAEIAAANSGDTIVFAPSLNGQTIQLRSELDIAKNLTVQGPGASQLTVSGFYDGAGGGGIRVFEVDYVTATIAGLTISNGYAYGYGFADDGGGGILNRGGNLTVSSCTISNNAAAFGGGICNEQRGILTVSGCTLTGNHFLDAESGGGGGVFNAYGGRATITASTLSGNYAPRFQSNVWWGTGGWYYDGGGIYNGGSMTLYGTTVTRNAAYQWGSGIYNDQYGRLSILSNSVVAGNGVGGDIFRHGGALTISSDSHVGRIMY